MVVREKVNHTQRVIEIGKTIKQDLEDIMTLASKYDDVLAFEEKTSEISALVSQLYLGYIEDAAEEMDFMNDMED